MAGGPITFIVTGQPVKGGIGGSGGSGHIGDPSGLSGTAVAGQRGRTDATAAPRWLPGEVKASVRLAALRGAGTPQTLSAEPGRDLVALHIVNGPVLLLHPENARDLLLAQADPGSVRRDRGGAIDAEASGAIEVGASLRWRGLEQAAPLTRGLGDVLLGAFEIIVLGKEKAVDIASGAVVKLVDNQVDAGLYRLQAAALEPLKGSGQRTAQVSAKEAAAGPLLVFVHGTFSNTAGTFGKLWKLHASRVQQLFEHYGGRVYGLEHETLGKSPIANALELVKALPTNARVHLVTHSRGGLVGEVLAVLAHRRALDDKESDADKATFAGDEYAAQRADLIELATEMAKRQISVERIVRVACPARGTLLAAKRLDAYLSVLKWAVEASGAAPIAGIIDLLAEVARRRTRPDEIPGLAAMIPGSPLVQWLNAAREPVAGELLAVAGDLEGDSIGSWIKTLLADAFYWTDSDLVVQTRSMYAGAPRKGGAHFLLDQGGKTTHFAYFANPRTVDAVVQALLQPKAPDGFLPIGPLSWAGEDTGGLRGRTHDPEKPAVFVLPGILGSNLKQRGHRIWLGLRLVGGLDRLTYQPQDRDGVLPDGAVSLVYDKLMDHLAATHEVIEFAFDWRRPMEEEAARLARDVDDALAARQTSGQPVRLLAHSMGGLVARTMQLVAPETWERLMARPGARLLMLGTPNAGSYAPMQVLSGDDSFGNVLAAVGSPLQDGKARRTMAGMPGFLQLQAGLLDPALGLDQQSTWQRLADDDFAQTQQNNLWHRYAGEVMEDAYRWGVPPQGVLDQAVALRRRLDEQAVSELPRFAGKLAMVLGRAKATPVGYEPAEPAGPTRRAFAYRDAGDGDGRAARTSALLPGVPAWQIDCEHGTLPGDRRAFDAYVELLLHGRTDKLAAIDMLRARTAPGSALDGSTGSTANSTDDSSDSTTRSRPGRQRNALRPASSEAAVFALADAAPLAAASAGAQLQIEVVNGNLSFVAAPLMVGHYRSSVLTGTEQVVDRLLGGKLSESVRVGHYPHEFGRLQVYLNNWCDPDAPLRLPRPKAVVVVGLGDEGALRESALVQAVQQAVIAWSRRLAEDDERATASTEMAATLLGSGGSGISASGSARAVARGVRQANLALADVGWPVVSRITLIELYLDRAAEVFQGLQVLAAAEPRAYALAPQIRTGTGPLRRKLENGYRGANYDLISAVSRHGPDERDGEEGTIEFVLDSRRARAEVRAQRTQVKLVRELVKRSARADAGSGGRALGRTLFQLLVPVEIEPFLGGTDRMLLDLDTGTAAIPWELLDAGDAGGDHRPWAIRSQLLRRLRSDNGRSPVRDAGADDPVLVIGEPLVDPDSGYPRLPGARDEARVVHETLTTRGRLEPARVQVLADDPDATSIVTALLARPWRIVHIAGHGEMAAGGSAGGVVLSGGLFLGASEFANMRALPELVFVNCCHLGELQGVGALAPRRPADTPAFAAGVAAALIDKGVRCVVACGWAVEDGPAHEFARRFYAELAGGARFIDAVAAAREACWRLNPEGMTWAAYQCYGDPDWRFDPRSDKRAAAPAEDEFAAIASPVGLALKLDTSITESRYMDYPPGPQQERLRQLEARFGERWGSIGAVAEAFGRAWEATGDRKEAMRWLELAVQARDGSATMKARETLQNLRARSAWDAASRAAGADPDAGGRDAAIDRLLAQALKGLAALVKDKATVERCGLLGSAYKRQALIERRRGHHGNERAALLAARAAYREGVQCATEEAPDELFYPALNVMTLDLLLAGDTITPPLAAPEALRSLEAARASQQRKSETDPDFWSQACGIELDIVDALAKRELAARQPKLAQALEDLHRRVKSPGHWASVADQADLLLGPFSERGPVAERAAALSLWKQLRGYAGRAD